MNKNAEILIVEENLTESEHLRHILEQHDYRISVEQNAKLALETARAKRPQIVISAVCLSEISGYDLCREIKAEEQLKHIPVILLTSPSADDGAADIIRGIECGADNFLIKPYDEELLISRIEYVLLNRELRSAAAAQTGVEVIFRGEKYSLAPERPQQIVDLLLSTYETAVRKNIEFERVKEELNRLKDSLEKKVAERKQAESELREKEQLLRAILDASRDGILIEEDSKITYTNASYAKLLGFQLSEELVGKNISEILPPDETERLIEYGRRRSRGERVPSIYEFKSGGGKRKDGTPANVEEVFSMSVIGGKHYIMASARDITARKRTANLLQNNISLLTSTFEATADGILVVDLNLQVVTFNKKFIEMWRIQKKAAAEKNSSRMLAAFFKQLKDAESFKKKLEKTLQNPEIPDFSILELKDGRFFECFSLPQKIEDKVIGRVVSYRDITDRKRAEFDLQKEREFLAAVLENISDGIVACDADGVLTFFNRATRRFHGLVEESIPAEKWPAKFDLYLPDGKTLMKKEQTPLFRALHDGSVRDVEMVIAPKNRPIRRLIASGNAIFDDHGEKLGAVVGMHDITERREAEKKAIEAAERFRFLAESMPQKIFTARPNGETDYVNRQWVEFSGLSFEQIIGWGWTQLIHPEDFDENVRSWKHSIETGEPFELENRCRRADGEYRWHLSRAHAMRDDDGKVLMWIGSNTDIHEQKMAQEALNIARLQLETALNAGAIATWHYDILNNRVVADKYMAQLFSVSPEDAAGGPSEIYHRSVHPDDFQYVKKVLAKAMAGGNSYEVDYRVVKTDGTIRWVQSRGLIERDKTGTATQMTGVMIDITERKEAEKALLETEERLQQSQKMEAIGTLTGGVAHDFNNLLTTILGNTQLAERKLSADDPIRPRLREIADAGRRAADLTKKLLAFSYRQHLQRRALNLNDSVGEIVKLLERIIGEDVEVSVKYADGLPVIFADPTQIEQVVMNLAINARDAMPSGGKLTIETSIAELDENYCRLYPYVVPGKYALIQVADNGTGMDEKTKERVFEPYFTTKEVDKGTGLGLSMAYGIIKQHGGHINLYSEPGLGTTFKVYLPLAVNQAVEEKVQEVLSPFLGGSETILVAEDEEALLKLTKDTLEALGYTVLPAKNGKEAVEIFAANRERIDLFLFDVIMPQMGGSEAYELIREMSESEIPLIFMTGYSAETVQNRFVKPRVTAERLGAAVLQKPYTLEELGRLVREVLNKNHRP